MTALATAFAVIQLGLAVPEHQLTPEQRFGSLDGPLAFSSVGQIAVAGGMLFVTQPRSGEVAIVRIADGRLVRTTQNGEGPGEFRIPYGAGVLGDTVWVADARLGRVSLFDVHGKLLTTIPFPALHTVVGLTTDGSVLAYRNPASPAADGSLLPLLRFSRTGARVDTLSLMRQKYPRVIDIRAGGRYSRGLNPFAQTPIAQLDSDGRSAVVVSLDGAPGREIEILRVLGTRRTAVNVRYPSQRLQLDDKDVQSMVAMRPELRTVDVLQRQSFPSLWVPVNRMLVARNGDVWLGSAIGLRPVTWIIVNRAGQIIGRLQSPAKGSLQIVDGLTVWGVELNEDDVPFVIRYRLRPT